MDLGTILTIGGAGLSCLGTLYSRKQSQKQQTITIASSVKNTLESIFLTKSEQSQTASQQLLEEENVEDEEDEAE